VIDETLTCNNIIYLVLNLLPFNYVVPMTNSFPLLHATGA